MNGERVIVRLPNWVGDVCMTLPALELLRAAGYQLDIFGKGWASDLLLGMNFQQVRAWPKSLAAQARVLRPGCRAVLFTNSFGSAFSLRLAGVYSTGFASDGRSWLLDQAIPKPRRGHEVDIFWQLAWAFSVHGGGWPLPMTQRRCPQPPRRLGLTLHADHRRAASAALAAAAIDGPYVVVAPLAVGTIGRQSKIYPHFAELAASLHAEGVTMVACPGPGEQAAMRAVSPHIRLLPDLGLGAYAAVCRNAHVVVANDSGPMHIAAAVDARVIGIFGVGDPGRTAPWGLRAHTIGSSAGWPDIVTVVQLVHSVRADVGHGAVDAAADDRRSAQL